MKTFLAEFKTFALKGNMMSMAVGILIGVGFQNLITSLTDNILSPIIGLFVRQNFDYLELHILGIELRYGAFITDILNFIIIAFVAFMMVRTMNKLLERSKNQEEIVPAIPPRICRHCMGEIHEKATRCRHCASNLEG